jgi:hypothetical protein
MTTAFNPIAGLGWWIEWQEEPRNGTVHLVAPRQGDGATIAEYAR